MNFIISASTDIGITKNTNQDSYDVKVLSTPQGKMVFAVLCDGKEKDGKPYTNYDTKFLIKPSAEKAA